MTVNVLLSSVQRLVALSPRSGTGLAEGETGQAKPDWPALADWLQNRLLPKAALRPPMFFGALRLIFCSPSRLELAAWNSQLAAALFRGLRTVDWQLCSSAFLVLYPSNYMNL